MLPFLKQRGQPQDPNPPPPITPALKVNETCAGLQLEDWDSLVPETNNSSHYSEVTRSAEQYVPEDGPSVCCPLQLKLTGSQRGGLDLQLQLMHLRFGDVWEPKARQQWAQKSNAVWWRWLSSSHVDVVNKALALCMLRLVLPDSMPPLVKYMAAMGGLSACCRVADRAQQWFKQLEEQRQVAAAVQLPAITAQRDTNEPQTNVAVQDTVLILSDRSAAVDRVGDWAEAAVAAALSLWLGGVIWRTCHPSSFHLLECISALVPVAAGYAHTARAAATGGISGGAQLEAAWRNRHKTTAQRVSHLMTDSYISPPLAPLMNLLEGVSIRAGVAVEGRGLDGRYRGTDDTTWTAPSTTGSHTNGLAANLSWQVGGSPAPRDANNPNNSRHPHQGNPHNSNGIPLDDNDDEVDLPAVSIAGDDDGFPEWSESQRRMALEDKVVKQEQRDFQQWHSAIGCCDVHVDDSSSSSREEAASPSWPQPTETSLTASPESPEAAGSWMSLLGSDDLGDSIERIAPLFGQSDHAAAPLPLTAYQKVELAGRACFLLLVFLPFLLFGSILLLLAGVVDPPAQPLTQQRITTTQPHRPVARTHVIADHGTPYQGWASVLRKWAFELLLVGCKGSGAAFIKWGQWAATREDIFPRDFCSIMRALHDRAPTHSYLFSKKEVERALGCPLSDTFSVFEKASLASGSIAQVHLARVIGAPENEWLAVKVRHPNVARQIWMDFQIMRIVAGLMEQHKSLKGLGVKESVSQFSHTMTAQADLRVEAAHLERFYRNFAPVRSSVTQPRPLRATESVLVESFEAGESVANYMGRRSPYNTAIVALGVDTYLKMLLQDNFVHTDLHPGNIMVRLHQDPRGVGPPRVQLILLDFGLAEELTPRVRFHFISFLNMIAKGDGVAATEHLLQWSATQNCPDPAAFTEEMVVLFSQQCDIYSQEGIDLDGVLKAILRLARKHQVSIDSNYASLVLGVCVLVGFATSLDPAVNLMDAAAPCLFVHNLTGRVLGRLYGS